MASKDGAVVSTPHTSNDKDLEKDVDAVSKNQTESDQSVDFVAEQRQLFKDKLCFKLDLHILTPMFFLNFLSLMGRTNIGAALIQGLPHELHLDAMKVFLCITMPLVMLILFEVPSNLLMKWLETKFGMSYMCYLSLITVGLGKCFLFCCFL